MVVISAPSALGARVRPRHKSGINRLILMGTVLVSAPALLDLSRFASGVFLIALVLGPIALMSLQRRKIYVADPFSVIGVMWVLAAGLPVLVPLLYEDPIWYNTPKGSIDTATLWMYRAWAAASVAYWFTRSVRFGPTVDTPSVSRVTVERIRQMRLGLGILGLFATVFLILMVGGASFTHVAGQASTSTALQIVTELRKLGLIYIFLYFYAKGRGELYARERWLLIGLLVPNLLMITLTASKLTALEMLAMWLLGKNMGERESHAARDNMALLLALALIYFVFKWVTAYRLAILDLYSGSLGGLASAIALQVEATIQATITVFVGTGNSEIVASYGVGSMLDRLAYVTAFATVLDITGGVSPYEHALETFLTPIYAVLPRSFFPEKAQFFGSAELAQLLGWDFGGFSVSLPGSIFWAWGMESLVPTMIVFGLFMALLARRAERDDLGGVYAKVLMIGVMLTMMDVGLTIHPIIIVFVRLTVFVAFVHFLLILLANASRKPRSKRERRQP